VERTLEKVRNHPIYQALNPEGKRFMEVRWLPANLNPFTEHDISIAALIPFTIFPHIKVIPTFQMMREDCEIGLYRDKHTIVVDSSGNTAHAVARLARAFGFSEVKVVLPADVPESKKGILTALSSVEIIEVSGTKSVAERAREEAKKPGHYHLNQYSHMGNLRGHELYTGPEIERALEGRDVSVIAVALGSGGTAGGVGRYIRRRTGRSSVIGVRPKLGEQVPGARDARRMEAVVTLPWNNWLAALVEVSRKESFAGMRTLWSSVEPQPGPTSGLAWKGLELFLKGLDSGTMENLRGSTVAFVCPDDGRFYSERTTGELDPDQGLV